MSKKYVESSGVSMSQPVQSSHFLTPGIHELELTAIHDTGTGFVLSLKRGDDIYIHTVEKETLEDGLVGTLGVFSKYNVTVELTDGVCAVAYGNGYNLMTYPDKSLLLDSPIDIMYVVRFLQENDLKVAVPKITRIEQI